MWSRRQLTDGIRSRVRTGVPWRTCPGVGSTTCSAVATGRFLAPDPLPASPGPPRKEPSRGISTSTPRCADPISTRPGPANRVVCRRSRRWRLRRAEWPRAGRSRGGFTTTVHLAVEQGRKPMSIVVTAGRRGDFPQFETVLQPIRVPRPGPGGPRTRPRRVRAERRMRPVASASTCVGAASTAPSRTRPTSPCACRRAQPRVGRGEAGG
ncbi:hypothetical protein ACIO8F_38590 [Streptomyces sp. NPDC087228]|uniref:hypothetical protein n=1 Tax=Streptomyces sp. NPDC087228 TaxID=3365772 RepID=UPI00382B6721